MPHGLLHLFAKQIYQIWLIILSFKAILHAQAHMKDNYHNPNFMIFKILMQKLYLNAKPEDDQTNHSH